MRRWLDRIAWKLFNAYLRDITEYHVREYAKQHMWRWLDEVEALRFRNKELQRRNEDMLALLTQIQAHKLPAPFFVDRSLVDEMKGKP